MQKVTVGKTGNYRRKLQKPIKNVA